MIHKLSKYLKEWLDFSVEPPPLPVPQHQVAGTVPLEDLQSAELLLLLSEGPEEDKDRVRQQENLLFLGN